MTLRRRTTIGLVFVAAFGGTSAALAQTVTRGPYLQRGTPASVVVRWRTNVATNARVRYGPAPTNLPFSADVAPVTTNHEVVLSGLTPGTRYYYSVGTFTATLAGGDTSHFFVTSPPSGSSKPTRIWVLGDSGTADANAAAVRNAYQTFTGSRPTDVWLMLGDNAYEDGTDQEYEAAVFDMYPSLLRQTVLWPTLGNHDGHTANSASQTGPYYDMFTLPRAAEAGGVASGTEAYYSFDYGNIHFVCLESYETDRSVAGAMLTWLQEDLQETTQPWIVAFWHHPPYTKGSHDSDAETELIDMRRNAVPILEAYGVDLVLTGHSHSYERSFLIDGHYGSSGSFAASMKKDGGNGRDAGTGIYKKPAEAMAGREGAVYAVAGSSGQISGGSLNHPAMFVSLNALGSMVLDVNGNRLDAVFLGSNGVVRDSFTLVKGEPIFSDGFEPGTLAAWTQSLTDGGDLSASPEAALASTGFGLQAVVDDVNPVYVQDNSPSNESRYRARFHFHPNDYDPGTALGSYRTRIFIAFEDPPLRRLATLVLKYKDGLYSIMGRARLDSGATADTPFIRITNAPHALEVDWRRASAPGANNGSLTLWIDGVLVASRNGLDNDQGAVDMVRLGAMSVKSGATGTLFFDEFVSRRLTYIGP